MRNQIDELSELGDPQFYHKETNKKYKKQT